MMTIAAMLMISSRAHTALEIEIRLAFDRMAGARIGHLARRPSRAQRPGSRRDGADIQVVPPNLSPGCLHAALYLFVGGRRAPRHSIRVGARAYDPRIQRTVVQGRTR